MQYNFGSLGWVSVEATKHVSSRKHIYLQYNRVMDLITNNKRQVVKVITIVVQWPFSKSARPNLLLHDLWLIDKYKARLNDWTKKELPIVFSRAGLLAQLSPRKDRY